MKRFRLVFALLLSVSHVTTVFAATAVPSKPSRYLVPPGYEKWDDTIYPDVIVEREDGNYSLSTKRKIQAGLPFDEPYVTFRDVAHADVFSREYHYINSEDGWSDITYKVLLPKGVWIVKDTDHRYSSSDRACHVYINLPGLSTTCGDTGKGITKFDGRFTGELHGSTWFDASNSHGSGTNQTHWFFKEACYSDSFKHDETYHWRECDDCGVEFGKQRHLDADNNDFCDYCKIALPSTKVNGVLSCSCRYCDYGVSYEWEHPTWLTVEETLSSRLLENVEPPASMTVNFGDLYNSKYYICDKYLVPRSKSQYNNVRHYHTKVRHGATVKMNTSFGNADRAYCYLDDRTYMWYFYGSRNDGDLISGSRVFGKPIVLKGDFNTTKTVVINETHWSNGQWTKNGSEHYKTCLGCGVIYDRAACTDANGDNICDVCGHSMHTQEVML